MTDLNHVILIGRLTRDAELKYSSSGFAICKFSIAVNRRRKNGEQWVDEANFFDISFLGKGAESVSQYLTKGKQIAVDGELQQQKWEQDGQTRTKVDILANSVQLLGGNAQASSQTERPTQPPASSRFTNQTAPRQTTQEMPPVEDFADDIPF